ncbi:pyridoxamine 5'-phosphate oxidase family protein [Halorussus lipolyticus]|uniref:pyridoxamine 5'-phosphate oxidase family protein n=1 Tax=Halorussus lipolyticus TaxID=3034024 RepID=UPI0023E861CD|nr:pyridoxamine 5'-phosphate oxidase family protein [Halorussus sp. DT80]
MNKVEEEEASFEGTSDERMTEPTPETPDVRMESKASAEFLEGQGWGCLTLADGGEAYSVPLSFGYDGDSTLYFQVQTDDDSDKMAYLDATTTATFLVPEVQPPEWSSVIVRGAVEKVPDDEADEAYSAFADNAWFPACPWTNDKDPAEVEFYKLEADELTGRTSVAGQ